MILNSIFRKIAFLFFGLGPLFLHAQTDTVFNRLKSDSFFFIYNAEAPDKIENKIIQLLAESNHTLVSEMNYSVHFFSQLTIVKSNEKSFHYQARLHSVECVGKTDYRGFPLCAWLTPDDVSFRLSVQSADEDIIKEQLFKQHLNYLQPVFNQSGMFTDSVSKQFSLQCQLTEIKYSDSCLIRLQQRLHDIDSYYEAVQTLQAHLGYLRKADVRNTDKMLVYDIEIKTIEKSLESLYNRNLPAQLHLTETDPAAYIPLMMHVSDTLQELKNQVNGAVSNLSGIYYLQGKAAEDSGNSASALTNYRKAVLFDTKHLPSNLALIRLLTEIDSLKAATDAICALFTLSFGANDQAQINARAEICCEKIHRFGDQLYNEDKFNESLQYFELEERMSVAGGTRFRCNEDYKSGISKTKTGLFRSYLLVANRAVEVGKPELSETYIDAANQYLQQNKSDVIDDGEMNYVLSLIADFYVKKSIENSHSQKFQAAGALLEKAETLQKKYNLPVSENFFRAKSQMIQQQYESYVAQLASLFKDKRQTEALKKLKETENFELANYTYITHSSILDSIHNLLNVGKYQMSMSQVLQALEDGNAAEAIQYYRQAKIAGNQYNMNPDNTNDTLIRSMVGALLLRDMDKAERQSHAGASDSAYYTIQEIKAVAENFKLSVNPALQQRMDEIQDEHRLGYCKKSRETYDSLYTLANYHILQHHFIEALALIDQALELAEKNPACTIDVTYARSDRSLYANNAHYQQLMLKAVQCLDTNNYDEFFYYYDAAEKYYITNKLGLSGLRHIPLSEKVSFSAQVLLIQKTFDYFVSKNRFDEALVCLKTLIQKQSMNKDLLHKQELLGRKMASRDHLGNPKSNPKLAVAGYAEGLELLDAFCKSYMKTWRSLR